MVTTICPLFILHLAVFLTFLDTLTYIDEPYKMERMINKYRASVSCIRLIFIISLCFLPTNILCSENTPSSKADKGLKMIEAMNQIKNIVVWKDDKWVNLTNFSHPHHIYAYETSHDQKYVFVWHEDYPPRVLSIFDLQEMKLIKNLSLGFGGDVKWNQENNIVHVYGCGSGCMAAKMLNIEGTTLFEIGGSPITISPTGRYLLLYTVNWVGHQNIELYDLSHKNLIALKKPLFVINGVGNFESINWNDERKITVTYTDAYFENDNYTKREFSFDLSRY